MPPLLPAPTRMYPSVWGAKVSQGYFMSVYQSHQLYLIIYEGIQPPIFCSFHILEKLLLPLARIREKSFDSNPETIFSFGGDGASPQATSQTRLL